MSTRRAVMITDPRNPPAELRKIGQITQTNRFGKQYPWTFFVNDGLLTILGESEWVDDDHGEKKPLFGQWEFPIGVARWIVEQLTPFKREGVLPGSLFVLRTEIDGEKLSLFRGPAIGGPGIHGFDLTNHNRKDHKASRFDQEFPMPDPFLFTQGLFDLWERIADEHQRGLY